MEVNENTCRPKLRSAFVSERGFLLIGSHVFVISYLSKWSTGTSCQSFCKNR